MFEGKPKPNRDESMLSVHENYAIEQLYGLLRKGLEQIRSEVESGTYGLIVGDDSSGRIPTLIMREAIGSIYKELGHPAPETRFATGSKDMDVEGAERKAEALGDHFRELAEELARNQKKALIVTDAIATGRSIAVLIKGLRLAGIESDVITAGVFHRPDLPRDSEKLQKLEKRLRTHIVAGDGSDGIPAIFHTNISGLAKNYDDLFAMRAKDSEDTWPGTKLYMQNRVNESRESAAYIGSLIARSFLTGEEPTADDLSLKGQKAKSGD